MFLIDEDTETLNEGLCSAIAARIDGGHDKLYHVCLGFLRDNRGPVKGPFSKRWPIIRKLWIAATVMMHLKRMDAIDDLLAMLVLDESLSDGALSLRVLDAIVAYGDNALPKLNDFLQKAHPYQATEMAWRAVAVIGGPKAVQILQQERTKNPPGSQGRRAWIFSPKGQRRVTPGRRRTGAVNKDEGGRKFSVFSRPVPGP